MAYCTRSDVALYLGRDLSNAEVAQVDAAIAAASGLVDAYTGRSWAATTVTGELHTIYSPYIYLRQTPVAAISTVTLRMPFVGATVSTLAAGLDYELIDPQIGRVLLGSYHLDPVINSSWFRHGSLITFAYTVSRTVPDPVKLATTMLAARSLLQGALDEGATGIKRVSIGDFEVQYQDAKAGSSASLPSDVAMLLSGYRLPVVFA